MLLPFVLLSDAPRGISAFLELLDSRASEARLFAGGTRCPLPPRPKPEHWTPEQFQFGAEVRLSDDLVAAGYLASADCTGREIPDAVLLLRYPDGFWDAVVIEAKLLYSLSIAKLDRQMADQSEHQIPLLRHVEPGLRAYRHIALLPRPLRESERLDNADGWLTWVDIATLAVEVLGREHYTSRFLATTARRCQSRHPPGGHAWEYVPDIDQVIARCQQDGNAIEIGCDRTAGGRELLQRPLPVLRGRTQPWKVQRAGIGDPRDWARGDEVLRLRGIV
jgi:hypothetical protein